MSIASPDESVIYYSSKPRITRLIGRIVKHSKENPDSIKIVKIPKHARGYYWPDNETIDVDYRYEILPTFIHEYLHHFHENWSEEKVVKEENFIMARISKKEAVKLIKAFAKALHV